jgi:REP element-mobilizing transposase RayT
MHSFTSILIHCVWSTKKREPFLNSDLRNRLWPYLGGVARENKMKALAIGEVADHVHMLISLPATLPVSKALQLLKGNSSRWIHETFPKLHAFEWQEGYGAFSVGISAVDATVRYIRDQEAHHRKRSFREELMTMLRRHGLDYEELMLD